MALANAGLKACRSVGGTGCLGFAGGGRPGGDRGGELVCAGTPETVAECKASHTGKFLKQILNRHEQWGEASA